MTEEVKTDSDNVPTTEFKFDSNYLAAFKPAGFFGGYNVQLSSPGLMLQQPFLTKEYSYNGLIHRIVDIYAEEMTRKGFKVDEVDEEKEKILMSRAEELNINNRLNTALKWRGAYGGGVIVLGINDGGSLQTPLREDGEIVFEFLRIYDRFEVTKKSRYTDPSKANFGEVEFWTINPRDGMMGYDVHESRIIVIDGETVPNELRMGNMGWGSSITQKVMDAVADFDRAHQFASLLLERMQQAIHRIPGLSEMLKDVGGAEQVQKRVALVDAIRSARNTVIMDLEEEFDIKANSLANIHELLDRKAEKVCAVSGIPMFVLFGRSIGGLNANGDTNQDAWNAQVAAMQNDVLRNPVDKIVGLLMREINGGSNDGGDYKIEFCPLSAPSDEKQAEIDFKKAQTRKADADAANVYIQMNALDPLEVRRTLQEYYEIDDKDLEKQIDNAPEEPEVPNANPQSQSKSAKA